MCYAPARQQMVWLCVGLWWLVIPLHAQTETDQCTALLQQALTSAAVCNNQGVNTACIGSIPVNVGLRGGDVPFVVGDTLALESLYSLQTGAADITQGQYGLAVLQTDAGLATGSVRLILFGDATIASQVSLPTPALPTLNVKNIAGYEVNLRASPSTNAPIITTFAANSILQADGRSPDGQWVRVRTTQGTAWVNQTLVSVEGEFLTLVPLASSYTAPMQAFRLQSAPSTTLCGGTAAGLLVQLENTDTAVIVANGVELTLKKAVLILQAAAETGLQVHVLAGEVSARTPTQAVTAVTGVALRVPLDSETLLANGLPQLESRYPFTAVAAAPLDLLGETDLQCIAGVTGDQTLSAYSGPGTEYSAAPDLDASSHYSVLGFAQDDAQQTWWKLDNGRWIPQNAAPTVGLCTPLSEVTAPPLTTPIANADGSYLPAEQTIYFAESGQDVMTGSCETPQLAICSHPAAIFPDGNGSFAWQGQEPVRYNMTPIGNQTYVFNGRNFIGDANLSLSLTFTSPTTWTMNMTTVYDRDSDCQHTFYYTAVKR